MTRGWYIIKEYSPMMAEETDLQGQVGPPLEQKASLKMEYSTWQWPPSTLIRHMPNLMMMMMTVTFSWCPIGLQMCRTA
jgi:hypothetical protein